MIDQLRSTQDTSKPFEKTTRITANPNEQSAKKKNGPPKKPRDVETSAIVIFSSIDFGNNQGINGFPQKSLLIFTKIQIQFYQFQIQFIQVQQIKGKMEQLLTLQDYKLHFMI